MSKENGDGFIFDGNCGQIHFLYEQNMNVALAVPA
jgi:hypothetical protein